MFFITILNNPKICKIFKKSKYIINLIPSLPTQQIINIKSMLDAHVSRSFIRLFIHVISLSLLSFPIPRSLPPFFPAFLHPCLCASVFSSSLPSAHPSFSANCRPDYKYYLEAFFFFIQPRLLFLVTKTIHIDILHTF